MRYVLGLSTCIPVIRCVLAKVRYGVSLNGIVGKDRNLPHEIKRDFRKMGKERTFMS